MVVIDRARRLMVPETAEEGVVRLYETTEFPHAWRPVRDLFGDAAVDPTVWFADGLWWFFVTVQEPRGKAGMLMLFSAATIDGEWVPHPLNPISQDVRTNRGAGGLFLDGRRLVRPSQDGSHGYGYQIAFNEVLVLSETDYRERTTTVVGPGSANGFLGFHTYARLGDLEAIDGKVARPRRDVV
jgi:hypothetical protein